MPHYRNPFERGNLYVKFDVTFPESHFANEVKLKVSFVYYFLALAPEYLSQHHLLKHLAYIIPTSPSFRLCISKGTSCIMRKSVAWYVV